MAQFRVADVQELKPTEAINPFYEVFRTLRNTIGVMVAAFVLLYLGLQIIPFPTSDLVRLIAALLIVSLPPALFFGQISSGLSQMELSGVPHLQIFLTTLLATSAIVVPVLYLFLQPEQWLFNENTLIRILGYATTYGVLPNVIIYGVVRYSAWSDLIERHLTVLYMVSAGLAVGCALSMSHYLLFRPSLDSFIIRVLLQFSISISASLLLSYGVMQLRRDIAALITTPLMFVITVVLTGIAITLRAGLMNASISVDGTNTRPLFALGFTAVVAIGGLGLGWFILTANDRKGDEERRDDPLVFMVGSEALTFNQRWANYLLLLGAVALLGAGLLLRDRVEGRTTVYQDAATGVTALYPANWLIDRNGPDYIFRVRNMRYAGFKTTIQVAVLAIGADTTERNVADRLAFERSQKLIDYRQLSVEPSSFAGVNADLVTYSFVSREASPFLESVPTVVLGQDIIFFNRGQAIVLTFRADASTYDREYTVFTRFLRTVGF